MHRCLLLLLLLIASALPRSSADELVVDSHPSEVRIPPGDIVMGSPGSRPGTPIACNRVYIRGHSRLWNPSKFAHALKVGVAVSQSDAPLRIQTIELCFHRNTSIGVGMCPASEWQKLTKSTWVQSISAYHYRILDVRMLPDPLRSVEVSTTEEFLVHRLFFLLVGIIMMAMARTLSESVVFYYGSAMTVGILLVILIVLFQGMRLLPTGRKSSLAIFIYSSAVGVTTFFLNYLSGLLRSALMEIGISEDMHNPLGIFLLAFIALAGAWFGYWGVRKLVLTEDGSVDSSVACFVEWAILILSAVMILQSSLDYLFALAALGFSVIITAITRTQGKSRFVRRLFRRMSKTAQGTINNMSLSGYSFAEYSRVFESPASVSPMPPRQYLRRASSNSPAFGSARTPLKMAAAGGGSYYSTYHRTPERRRPSKEEWEAFTKEETRKAVAELVSSPDFNRWALANANRISVTPPGIGNGQKRRRFFPWF